MPMPWPRSLATRDPLILAQHDPVRVLGLPVVVVTAAVLVEQWRVVEIRLGGGGEREDSVDIAETDGRRRQRAREYVTEHRGAVEPTRRLRPHPAGVAGELLLEVEGIEALLIGNGLVGDVEGIAAGCALDRAAGDGAAGGE